MGLELGQALRLLQGARLNLHVTREADVKRWLDQCPAFLGEQRAWLSPGEQGSNASPPELRHPQAETL